MTGLRLPWIVASLIVISPTIHSASILGKYQCHGQNPLIEEKYQGSLLISVLNAEENVYELSWELNNDKKFTGRGFLIKNTLSAIFKEASIKKPSIFEGLTQEHNTVTYGLIQYQLNNSALNGKFTYHIFQDIPNSHILGYEDCRKEK